MQRILIHRLGSIGDFVVALPALHAIRRAFPGADIRLLTSRPADRRVASARSVLEGAGLLDDDIAYTVGTRSPRDLLAIRRDIRAFAPELVVYLMDIGGLPRVLRDYAFFRWCGVAASALVMPFAPRLRTRLPRQGGSGLWEPEAQRLARCVAAFGAAAPEQAASWDLRLSAAEIAEADRALGAAFGDVAVPDRSLVAMSIGTKQAVNDWGDDNWHAVLGAVGRPQSGLVLIGAAAERERSAQVARDWTGPVANLCGRTSPRVSAAAMRRARLFLGHDSGPMHLAAAVGTPCVVVFSKRNRPGEWFPFGDHHRVFYPPPEARSIRAISPAEIIAAATRILYDAEQAASVETM